MFLSTKNVHNINKATCYFGIGLSYIVLLNSGRLGVKSEKFNVSFQVSNTIPSKSELSCSVRIAGTKQDKVCFTFSY